MTDEDKTMSLTLEKDPVTPAISPPGGEASAEGPATGRSAGRTAAMVLERFGLPIVVLLTILLFSALRPDTFFTLDNLRSILSGQSVLAVLAIAALIPLVVGQFDLSIAAVLGLSSLATAALMSRADAPLVVAAAGGIGIGAAIGLVNGLVVARIGVNSIITTLGMASVLAGAATGYSEGQTIATGISTSLVEFGSAQWLGLPRVFFVLVAVALLIGYLLRATPFGRSLYATGTNDRAARLVGLPVQRLTVISFVLAGAVAASAGVLQLSISGSADPQFGPNLLLPALTAAFLGATTIKPGQYNILGTLVAIAFLATSLSGLALVGAPAWVEPVYTGATLVIAVAVSTIMRRRRAGA